MCFRKEVPAQHHIVISGGCGAIGVGIVRKLREHGAKVTVNDILAPEVAEARLQKSEINLEKITYIQANLTQVSEVEGLVRTTRWKFCLIHTALCHVGTIIPKPLLDYAEDEWTETMEVNVKTAFLLGKASARAMLEDEVSEHLIFTTSWVADVPWPEIGPYNASKAAMKQLMRSFARELADRGVRANTIAPGIVDVGLVKRQWNSDPSYRARAKKQFHWERCNPVILWRTFFISWQCGSELHDGFGSTC